MSDPQPVFPATFATEYYGLTKRELFAAMAMQGLIAGAQGGDLESPLVAKCSILLADALIAALNRKESDA